MTATACKEIRTRFNLKLVSISATFLLESVQISLRSFTLTRQQVQATSRLSLISSSLYFSSAIFTFPHRQLLVSLNGLIIRNMLLCTEPRLSPQTLREFLLLINYKMKKKAARFQFSIVSHSATSGMWWCRNRKFLSAAATI